MLKYLYLESLQISVPDDVKKIIKTLNDNNKEAYIVGGCVRDSILHKTPKDWDITTNAKPNQVLNIFEDKYKVIPTGIKYGTVTVIINNIPYEITTYRKESDYTDSRRPNVVSYSDTIQEDLQRRDFCLNALAYNPNTGELIDIFGGEEDLKNGIIRAVGNPDERFKEDALRMLRAIRFASRYNFKIEENTFKSIQDNAESISNISKERVRIELNGIISSDNPELGLDLLKDSGLLKYTLKSVQDIVGQEHNNPHHIYDIYNHTKKVVANVKNKPELKWAGLLHDIGKPSTRVANKKGYDSYYGHPEKSYEISKGLLKDLTFDNKSKDYILGLVREHDRQFSFNKTKFKHSLNYLYNNGVDFLDLMELKLADIKAHNPETMQDSIDKYNKWMDLYNEIIQNNEPYLIKQLAISGQDIKNLDTRNVIKGEEFGKLLNILLDIVIANPEKNTKEQLLHFVQNYIDKKGK